MQISDRVRRVLRALQQAGGAVVVVQVVLAFIDLTDKQSAALTGGLTWLFAGMQNWLEAAIGRDIGIAKTDESAEGSPAL